MDQKSVLLWLLAVLGLCLAGVLAAVLIVNDGVFTYMLDDPYIHLQFSRQVWQGHFGLVAEEISSPSSSILWPLLLAPFSTSALHEFMPLLFNIVATALSAAIWQRVLFRFVVKETGSAAALHAACLTLAILLATNVLGLAFSGMEHSLQIAATLAAVAGAIELIETGRVRWWLIVGVIAGPLLRYENIPISATAIGVMLAAGAWFMAGACVIAIVTGLGTYAAVSLGAGLPPVPGSLTLKSGLNADFPLLPQIRSRLGHFTAELLRGRWLLEGWPFMVLLAVRLLVRGEKQTLARFLLLAGVLGTMLLQLIFGAHYNFSRYDCFSLNAGLLCLAYFYRGALCEFLSGVRPWQTLLVAGVMLASILPRTSGAFVLTPLAAQDIYWQQWQMAKFMATLENENVGVHDVGLTSYKGKQTVLDLVGLGSEEIRQQKMKGSLGEEALRALLSKRNISSILVFPNFKQGLPLADMELIARFHLGRRNVVTLDSTVALYATSAEAADRLRRKAESFAPSMPPGTRLEVLAR